jgi:DNA-binding NarL/FixJ family response regulator
MGDHLAVGTTSTGLDVAVGIGVATDDLEPADVTGAAMASIRSARHHRRPSIGAPRPFVAVSRIPGGPAIGTSRQPGSPLWSSDHPRFVRRTLVSLSDEAPGDGTPASTGPKSARTATRRARQPSREATMRVLVVDLDPMRHTTRLGAAAVASLTRRAGALPTVSTASALKRVMLDHYVVEPDAVVVVLHPERGPRDRAGGDDPWQEAALLTRTLRRAGTPVVVVSVGASALAVAACVEEGATGLFGLEELPDTLMRGGQQRQLGEDSQGSGSLDGLGGHDFPEIYSGLVKLTPAERRVLHQMMLGKPATEIAAEQVVALSTVRTHIRSILRKLHVSSQLAAVAIAHGSIPLGVTTA